MSGIVPFFRQKKIEQVGEFLPGYHYFNGSSYPMGKICFVLACIVLAGACNFKTIVASQDFSGDAPVVPPGPATDSVYLLGLDDKVADSSSFLADVTIYSPLFWPEAHDHSPLFLMLDQARKKVREMGGNAIQLLDCSARKFARLRLVARVYSLRRPPPVSPVVPPDRCILHIKSAYAASGVAAVPIYFNDSMIATLKGSDLADHRRLDFIKIAQQRMEQFTIALDRGGLLSVKQGVHRFVYTAKLENGREYYVFALDLSMRIWSGKFLELVTKEEFDLNQYRY